jgi:hypothetical protein
MERACQLVFIRAGVMVSGGPGRVTGRPNPSLDGAAQVRSSSHVAGAAQEWKRPVTAQRFRCHELWSAFVGFVVEPAVYRASHGRIVAPAYDT